MKSHRSRIHSHTDDDTDQSDEHYKGSVMQPLIVQPLKDYKLTEGQDATFFCKVAGVPKPKVRPKAKVRPKSKGSCLLILCTFVTCYYCMHTLGMLCI